MQKQLLAELEKRLKLKCMAVLGYYFPESGKMHTQQWGVGIVEKQETKGMGCGTNRNGARQLLIVILSPFAEGFGENPHTAVVSTLGERLVTEKLHFQEARTRYQELMGLLEQQKAAYPQVRAAGESFAAGSLLQESCGYSLSLSNPLPYYAYQSICICSICII